jgi:hypothetical protein
LDGGDGRIANVPVTKSAWDPNFPGLAGAATERFRDGLTTASGRNAGVQELPIQKLPIQKLPIQELPIQELPINVRSR